MLRNYIDLSKKMETSLDDSTTNAIHSPPKRRRSTFFEKRDSIIPNQNEATFKERETVFERDSEELIAHLEKYQENLRKEKELWKTEAKTRRLKYKDLKGQLAVASGSLSVDYSLLTDDDILLLKGKPNIKKIATDCENFHASVCETMIRLHRWRELQNAVLEHCEHQIDQIQEYILENSSVGIGEEIANITTANT